MIESHRMPPRFTIVGGRDIHSAILSNIPDAMDVVRDTYIAHHNGETVNPDSIFLRFPNRPSDRSIALPAHIASSNEPAITGIKWISSFPQNIASGMPRASAVIILNDPETGFPCACLEGSIISAARTAASAALAAFALNGKRASVGSIGVVGCGLIAEYIVGFLLATGWSFCELNLYDTNIIYANRFVRRTALPSRVKWHIHQSSEDVARNSELIVFATTATSPHVHSVDAFKHNPLVLHVSLRDLAPEIILAAHNVVDDLEHCMKANTSVHLAEQRTGTREFVRFSLPGILSGESPPDRSKPVVFSPFGMGILDIAMARRIFDKLVTAGSTTSIPDFYFDRQTAL